MEKIENQVHTWIKKDKKFDVKNFKKFLIETTDSIVKKFIVFFGKCVIIFSIGGIIGSPKNIAIM